MNPESLFPYDEFTAENAVAAAHVMDEAVRYLNHATLRRDTLPDPVDVARVLGSLHSAVTRLPQLLVQLAEQMRDYAAQPGLGVEAGPHGTHAPTAARGAAGELAEASAACQRVSRHIAWASQNAARLKIDAS